MNFPNIDYLKMKPNNLNYKFYYKITRIKSAGEGTQQEPGACSTQPQNVQEEWQTREEGCIILFMIVYNGEKVLLNLGSRKFCDSGLSEHLKKQHFGGTNIIFANCK